MSDESKCSLTETALGLTNSPLIAFQSFSRVERNCGEVECKRAIGKSQACSLPGAVHKAAPLVDLVDYSLRLPLFPPLYEYVQEPQPE